MPSLRTQERRQVSDRRSLHTEEEQFRLLVQAVKDYAIFMLDTEGRVATWNAGAQAIKGYSEAEIVGQPFSRFYTPEDVSAGIPARVLAIARETGHFVGQGERVRKDGSRFWADIVITALRDASGNLRGYAKVTRDVTEQRRAALALAESEARFRGLADNISQFAWMADKSGAVFWYNRRWYEYSGTTLEEMRGWGWRAMHHPEHLARVEKKFRAAIEAGHVWEDTFPLRGADGQYRWFLSRAVPQDDGKGGRVWFGTNTDVTEQLEAASLLERRVEERTAELAEANLEMEAFNYTVSHDLRAPLRAIRGFAEILVEDFAGELGHEGRLYCERISAAGERMEQLIEDLLAYGRLSREELSVRAVELEPLVDEVVEQLAGTMPRHGATVEVERPLPAVKGHRPMLRQVFFNLLGNALKFVAPGTPPSVRVRCERRGALARLIVEDNGIGVAPEHRERIFRAFERLHGDEQYRGTGIGLAIVRRAMERLGGAAGMEPREGGGSRFWIEVPAA